MLPPTRGSVVLPSGKILNFFNIFDARMWILECRIGIGYGDDNMAVVETSGEKQYELTIFAYLDVNRLHPL